MQRPPDAPNAGEHQNGSVEQSTRGARRKRPAMIAAAIGLGLSLAASSYLLLAPCFVRGMSGTETIGGPGSPSIRTEQTFCESFVEGRGTAVLLPLGLPVVLALVGFLATLRNWSWVVGLVAVLLHLFWLATGFSIGLLYFPTAIAMTVALVLSLVVPRGG